ncbi:MAG: hypothetical protein JW751_24595, partial [Polyangiaceae bacterium]|nr:hypothetical protein [Polyangiaceae bacterium]
DRADRGFADPMAFRDGRTEDGKRPWLGLQRRRGGFGGGGRQGRVAAAALPWARAPRRRCNAAQEVTMDPAAPHAAATAGGRRRGDLPRYGQSGSLGANRIKRSWLAGA